MIKTLADLTNSPLNNKRVLLRVDFNVPIQNAKVTDASRIIASKKTIDFLIARGATVYLLSHFGRPNTKNPWLSLDKNLSLEQIVSCVADIIGKQVQFIPAYSGDKVQDSFNSTNKLFLLENIRFAPGEEQNSVELAKNLALGMDLYVNDAFSCAHRAHTSIDAITYVLPSAAGFHFATEVFKLHYYLDKPNHPLGAIIGGSKLSTKLPLLRELAAKVDLLVIGGGMANTFLKAKGVAIGSSIYEGEFVNKAADIISSSAAKIILPLDVVVANTIKEPNKPHTISVADIQSADSIFDIGPLTVDCITQSLKQMRTIVWNGPLGVFENRHFAGGTIAIARALSNLTSKGVTVVAGGGDTLAALNQAKVKHPLSYLSTAGGAFLQWLGGGKLPGVERLRA